ncbi:kinase-like domain-containing protein [Syncephalis fuscata]|nr:kinase-like domain-containing protein [Syncephalis fuscata]
MAHQQESERRASRRREHVNGPVLVGDYIVGSEIGRGSFATVYKGRHRNNGQRVAVKAVSRSKLTKKLLENLEAEIKILKSVRHDHVVHLFDCQKSERHIYLIMEYCSLGDLTDFIKRRADRVGLRGAAGGLKEPVVRHFLFQLGRALEFLRSKNLIHRDIKPQNLLLLPNPLADSSESGNPMEALPTLKIADFGFARFLPSQSLAETLCGSPLYMAPEILRYEKYDAKADLWSVGAVLYEMCCGRPPFRAHNHIELLHRIEKKADNISFPEDREPPENGVRPVIADDIKDLIRKLLKRNPVERISFEEFFLHPCVVGHAATTVARPIGTGPITLAAEAFALKQRENNLQHNDITTAMEALNIDGQRHPQARIVHRVSAVSPFATAPRRNSGGFGTGTPRHGTDPLPTPNTDIRADTMPARRDSDTTRGSPRGDIANAPSNRRESFLTTTSPEERDYVVVEKQAVQVNVLADDIAASPHITPAHSRQPSVNPGMDIRSNSPALHGHSGSINGSPSYENAAPRPIPGMRDQIRGMHNSPDSILQPDHRDPATNQWQRAGQGMGISPAYSSSPPTWAMYTRRSFAGDRYQATQTEHSPHDPSLQDDIDETTMFAIDTAVCQSYAVFKFADRKLTQLLDIPVSTPQSSTGASADGSTETEPGQMLANEALVLYLCALSSLQRGIDVARKYWEDIATNNNNNTNNASGSGNGRVDRPAPQRLNDAVQWMRDQFNATLEKAEYVKNRASSDDHLTEIRIENCYTIELWKCRTAAINELVGDDLPGCDRSYQQAVWLLGAILDDPESIATDVERGRIEEFLLSIQDRIQVLHRRMEPTIMHGI